MSHDSTESVPNISSETAEHIAEAREKARHMLAGEAHLTAVDDWRRVLVGARDSVLAIWLIWVVLQGFGNPPMTPYLLMAVCVGLSLLTGLSTGRSTQAQVDYYASELEREREEIRDNFEHECEEVRALYAAKGFVEPLLTEIVDRVSEDEDRLLKFMMEEELGLSMHHVPHPLMVGFWNFSAACVVGMCYAVPMVWLSARQGVFWMICAGIVLLSGVALVTGRAAGRSALELFTVSVVMAVVTSGVVYFLAQWFSSWALVS